MYMCSNKELCVCTMHCVHSIFSLKRNESREKREKQKHQERENQLFFCLLKFVLFSFGSPGCKFKSGRGAHTFTSTFSLNVALIPSFSVC